MPSILLIWLIKSNELRLNPISEIKNKPDLNENGINYARNIIITVIRLILSITKTIQNELLKVMDGIKRIII